LANFCATPARPFPGNGKLAKKLTERHHRNDKPLYTALLHGSAYV
jgi:hypothetical protein